MAINPAADSALRPAPANASTTVRPALIGQLLLARGAINQADLDQALLTQASVRLRLGALLIRAGAVSEDQLYEALAQQLGLTLLSAEQILAHSDQVVESCQKLGLPLRWCQEQGVVPWLDDQGRLHCAAKQPYTSLVEETFNAKLPGHITHWLLAKPRDVDRCFEALNRLASTQTAANDDLAHLREMAQEVPVIELVNGMFASAVDLAASDIHVEPQAYSFSLRYRIDGVLHTKETYGKERFDAVACRIKLISGLDIAERRLPQDGRTSIRAGGQEMDVRVSVIPGVHGESIVMRMLPKERQEVSLDKLGFSDAQRKRFESWIDSPNGIVLVTGPTGSGKSTSLYAALARANDGKRKIITVEDPVEYQVPGITQIQTHSEIGYTFARALRSILRHDPDIIMIGEIRDLETAEIAVQSSLTGHMVFSTLHTNDALGAFARLTDMGVEPFLVANSVRGVFAQRLVRKLCPHCCKTEALDPLHQEVAAEFTRRYDLRADQLNWKTAVGCERCSHTGYKGRTGVFEFVSMGPALQHEVLERASPARMAQVAKQQPGYMALRDDALHLASRGITSLDEVLRVTGSGHSEQVE